VRKLTTKYTKTTKDNYKEHKVPDRASRGTNLRFEFPSWTSWSQWWKCL